MEEDDTVRARVDREVETGNGTTTPTIQEAEYGLCACSPMGRMMRAAEAYAPGGSLALTKWDRASGSRGRNHILIEG